MSMSSGYIGVALVAASTVALAHDAAKAPTHGTPVAPAELVRWSLNVFPDGRGLPNGRGNASEGKTVYAAQCESCHGDDGRGSSAEELVAGKETPTAENPSKAIGPYWPYATTIFDYIRRAMPPSAPGSLSADQLYAVTAYLLNANGIIAEKEEITAETLPDIKMPNRDGFIRIDAK